MACILQPECDFLHGYFRCLLPVEVVDVEVKITSMQGTHIFWRERMTQLIKCTLWSARLCPHPMIVKKMRTFLEVEGKMGPVPQPTSSQYKPPQLDTNPNVRKDRAQKREKEWWPPRGSGITQPLSPRKQMCTYPQQSPRPQIISNLKCKKELQKLDPHLRRCPSPQKHSMAWCWKDFRKSL